MDSGVDLLDRRRIKKRNTTTCLMILISFTPSASWPFTRKHTPQAARGAAPLVRVFEDVLDPSAKSIPTEDQSRRVHPGGSHTRMHRRPSAPSGCPGQALAFLARPKRGPKNAEDTFKAGTPYVSTRTRCYVFSLLSTNNCLA